MPSIARVGDRTQGVCAHPSHSPPISVGGTIVSGSGHCNTEGPRNARIGDSVKTDCGHSSSIVSGSGKVFDEGSPLARIGDKVAGGAPYSATITGGAQKGSAG
jgi:uncharacterized Zn-binding protein involved in type VI secretion